jgi:uncharacterized membrane protein YqiK
MKVELVPTTNIVLNWANRSESHHYDAGLDSVTVRSRDGFSFELDVAAIIHIGMKNAPRVISRVGSMQNLVDHVLQPTVGNYFRNSAQEVTVLEFLSARSARQRAAYLHIRAAVAAYDVDCIDALIGDITAPGELMKTQTDQDRRRAEARMTCSAGAESSGRCSRRETAAREQRSRTSSRSEQAVRIHEGQPRRRSRSHAVRPRRRGSAPGQKPRSCACRRPPTPTPRV